MLSAELRTSRNRGQKHRWISLSLGLTRNNVQPQRWLKKPLQIWVRLGTFGGWIGLEERGQVAVGRRRQRDERVAERHPHAKSRFGAMAIRLAIGPRGCPGTCGTRVGVFGTTRACRPIFAPGKVCQTSKIDYPGVGGYSLQERMEYRQWAVLYAVHVPKGLIDVRRFHRNSLSLRIRFWPSQAVQLAGLRRGQSFGNVFAEHGRK